MTPVEYKKMRKFELAKAPMPALRQYAKELGCAWTTSDKLIDSIIAKEIKNKLKGQK